MICIRRYTPKDQDKWDEFVSQSKSTTFLHRRTYMDYHKDRFQDYSIMVYDGDALVALLPANKVDGHTIASHQGLTYGGFILHPKVGVSKSLLYIYHILHYLSENGFDIIVYKAIPKLYTSIGTDAIDYALFMAHAELYRVDISLAIKKGGLPKRARERRRAIREGIYIKEEENLRPFWEEILTPNLKLRFGVEPVHKLDEITYLKTQHPSHIRQFSAYLGDDIIAGTTIFEAENVAHAQYISAGEKGKKLAALDVLFYTLAEDIFNEKDYFNLGIVNEEEGRKINHGLLRWKEKFGAKPYAHHFYSIKTENYRYLESVLKN